MRGLGFAAGARTGLLITVDGQGTSCDIADFDATYGVEDNPFLADPLRAAHEMMTAYARSTGQMVWALSALLTTPAEFTVTPGALVRPITVHSARMYRLSDPELGALERCNLGLYFAKAALARDASYQGQLVPDIDKWINGFGLGRPKGTGREEALVASLFADDVARVNRGRAKGSRKLQFLLDDNFYEMSRLVHGDPPTLMLATDMTARCPAVNRMTIVQDALAGMSAAYKAGNRFNVFRSGPMTGYDTVYRALTDVVDDFRQVRDRVESVFGFGPSGW